MLFAVGCATKKRTTNGNTNGSTETTPTNLPPFHFQVDPKTDLYAPAMAAAEKWSAALGRTITVSPDGEIPIFYVTSLSPPAAPTDKGFSWSGDEARIEVLTSVPESVLPLLLLHEMGHVLRGVPGHVTNNPKAVMAKPAQPGATITPEDIAFICEYLDCVMPDAP